MGGIYAAGVPINDMIKASQNLSWRNFAKFHLSRRSMFTAKPIEKLITSLVGDICFSELKFPFYVVLTDILKGTGIAMNDADVRISEAIRASCSFPGIFDPVKIKDTYYFDGNASFNLPANIKG